MATLGPLLDLEDLLLRRYEGLLDAGLPSTLALKMLMSEPLQIRSLDDRPNTTNVVYVKINTQVHKSK